MLRLFKETGFGLRRCTWELTLACNLRCGHCGSRAGKPRDDELTTDEALAVVDDLARLGCRHVTLAGGEPTLREDWNVVAERITTLGIKCSILSNGVMWTDEMTQRARQARLTQVAFSLDGLEVSHDRNRRIKGGFERVMKAIDRCLSAGFRVAVVTHVTKNNIDELEEMHESLGQRGVSAWQVQLGFPQGNLCEERDAILEPDDMLRLIPLLAKIRRNEQPPKLHLADNIGYYGEYETELRAPGKKIPFWVGCRAGLDVVGLESNGNVKGCLSLPSELNERSDFIEGNVKQRSLVEIWNNPEAFPFTRQFSIDALRGDCAQCEYGEICRGGCTVTSVSHFGQPHQYPNCYHFLTK